MQIKSDEKISLIKRAKEQYPQTSVNQIKRWITQKRLCIGGKVILDPRETVDPKGEVTLGPKVSFARGGIKIVFEDRYLVVVDKPKGLLSVGTEKERFHSVHNYLKQRTRTGKVYPIHRLDKDTCGLMVFAYTPEVKDGLKEQLAEREISREYRAWIEGDLGEEGCWRDFLAEGLDLSMYKTTEDKGKEAVTFFKRIEQKNGRSLLHIKLQTGRKHQIRAQAALRFCPIIGDRRYGSSSKEPLCLEAVCLKFVHPKTGQKMDLRRPL